MKKNLNFKISPLQRLMEQKEKLEEMNIQLDDLGYEEPDDQELCSGPDSSYNNPVLSKHESKSTDNNFSKKRSRKLASKSPNKHINKTDYNFYKRPGNSNLIFLSAFLIVKDD